LGSFLGQKLIFICFSVVKCVLSAENSSLLQNQEKKGHWFQVQESTV
jgi:hypothetical protein